MAATTALGSSWALESGSLEHTFTVARADSDEPGSAGAEGLRDSEEAGSADAQGVRDSGPLWCTLRKGEGGEDAPCHVAVLFRGPGAGVLGVSVTSSARFVEAYSIADDCGTPQAALGRTHDYLCTLRCSPAHAPLPASQRCGSSTSTTDNDSKGPLGPSRLPSERNSHNPDTVGASRAVNWMQGSLEMSEEGAEGEQVGKESRGLLLKFLGVPSPKDRLDIFRIQIRVSWDFRDREGEAQGPNPVTTGAETTRGAAPLQTPGFPRDAFGPARGELGGTPGMHPALLPLMAQMMAMPGGPGKGVPSGLPAGVPGAGTGSAKGLPPGLGPMAMLLQQAQVMGVPGATDAGRSTTEDDRSARGGVGDREVGGTGEAEPLTKAASAAAALAAALMGRASYRHTQHAHGQVQHSLPQSQAQPQPQPHSQSQLQSQSLPQLHLQPQSQSQSQQEQADAQQAQTLLQMQRLLAAGPAPHGTGTTPGAGQEACKENLGALGNLGGLGGALLAAMSQKQVQRGGDTTLAEGDTRANQQANPGPERPAERSSSSLCPGPSEWGAPGTPQGGAGLDTVPGAGTVSGAELVRRMDAQEQRLESILSSFAAMAASLERSMAQLSARVANLESCLLTRDKLLGDPSKAVRSAGSEDTVEPGAGSPAVKLANGFQDGIV